MLRLKLLLLASSLCIGFVMTPAAESALTKESCQLACQGVSVTGELGAYVHGSDGYTYFMLGNVLLRIRTVNFPANPAFGDVLTAEGCTPGPGAVDYTCTWVQ